MEEISAYQVYQLKSFEELWSYPLFSEWKKSSATMIIIQI